MLISLLPSLRCAHVHTQMKRFGIYIWYRFGIYLGSGIGRISHLSSAGVSQIDTWYHFLDTSWVLLLLLVSRVVTQVQFIIAFLSLSSIWTSLLVSTLISGHHQPILPSATRVLLKSKYCYLATLPKIRFWLPTQGLSELAPAQLHSLLLLSFLYSRCSGFLVMSLTYQASLSLSILGLLFP